MYSRLVTKKEREFRFRTHLYTRYASSRSSQRETAGMFHDLASAGISEPMLRLEREQPRDNVPEAVPQHRLSRPFVIKCQDILEY